MDVETLISGHSAQISGMKTNYLDEGTGAPVVLVHGSGPGVSAFANWERTIPVLAKHFRVIAPDLAGFGLTIPPNDVTYGLDLWTNHLVGLLDRLGIERASFVGNSFGGGIALALAVRFPERVERLMLMGTAGLDYVPPIYPRVDPAIGLTGEVMKQLARRFTYYPDSITDGMVQLRLDTMKATGGMAREGRMFPGNPRLSRVSVMATPAQLITEIKSPTLLVHGRDDQIMPPSISLRLNELIENSDLHLFARCGHWSQLDRFDEFNALAIAFFNAGKEQ